MRQNINLPLIVMSGLIGTGKSTTARTLAHEYAEYTLLSTSGTRRGMGITTYRPEDGKRVREQMIKEAIALIEMGQGVIFDTINNTYAHRKEDYDFALDMGIDALVIETKCSENLAKTRLAARPQHPGRFNDTNDPREYDRVRSTRENFDQDLIAHPNLTYLCLDTESRQGSIIRCNNRTYNVASGVLETLGYSQFRRNISEGLVVDHHHLPGA